MGSGATAAPGATMERWRSHLAERGEIRDGAGLAWRPYKGVVLQPITPPHRIGKLDRAEVRRTLRRSGARMARWSEGWDLSERPWWFCCCDDPGYDLQSFSKNARRDVRRGLRECECRRLDMAWFAENGYAAYVASQAKYGSSAEEIEARFPRERFQERMRTLATYPGSEVWGARIGDVLAAYVICIVVDDVVHLQEADSDPGFHRSCPNNALFYSLTRHYLAERGMRYTTDGSRPVLHQTNIQAFLEKMGYRRVYCNLCVEMVPALRLAVGSGVHRWGRHLGLTRLAPGPMRKLAAVAELDRIATACRHAGQTGDAEAARARPNGNAAP